MSITEGADADALDRLAGQIEQGASHIEGTYGPVRQSFHGSSWQGVDADQFASEWDGPSKSRLTNTATALRDAAKTLRKNANEQRTASDMASGSSGRRAEVNPPQPSKPSGWSRVGRILSDIPVVSTVYLTGKSAWDMGTMLNDAQVYGWGSSQVTHDQQQGVRDSVDAILSPIKYLGDGIGMANLAGVWTDYEYGTSTDNTLDPGYWLSQPLIDQANAF